MELNELKHNKLKTQADAVQFFLQRMDIEMVSDILDDNRTYQGFEKIIFIHKLGVAINELIATGDTFLDCYRGFCNAEDCNYKCTGFSFIGNKSKNYFDLIIKIQDGVVDDMYECSEFKNLEKGFKKQERIRINKFKIRF
jgi:hypothetical protein